MITKEVEDLFLRGLDYVDKKVEDTHIIELGNLAIKDCLDVVGKRSSKDLFISSNCASHTSIDLNGRDGALPLDLGKRLSQFDNTADVVINGGTAEHVANMYGAFQNMHEWCKVGGIMINWGPPAYTNPNHSTWAYQLHFPADISRCNNYILLEQDIRLPEIPLKPNVLRRDTLLIAFIFQKTCSKPFMSLEDWWKMNCIDNRTKMD